ncbi:MAG: TIGR03086 family metal-binding protein [Pseudonocardiaceae bacterium]
MELLGAHQEAMDGFDTVLRQVRTAEWDAPTPCSAWSVSALVNHLVSEQLWVPSLLRGATIEQQGSRFDGDNLGDDPVAAWRSAAAASRTAWLEASVLERMVHLSFGTVPATQYCWQMTLDLAVHAWDLATGIGAEYRIADELAATLLDVFAAEIPRWHASGLFGPPVFVPEDADLHTQLIALLGRHP